MIRDIGTRRELFVDEALIESSVGARLELQRPERREIAMEFNAPWEDSVAFPYRILPCDDGWRLYYRAGILDLEREEDTCVTAMATTSDGIEFVRPELGICEFRAAKRNNILRIGGFPSTPPPFFDTKPGCTPDQRFKGISGRSAKAYGHVSSDGLNWSLLQEAPLNLEGQFDAVNTAFWDTVSGCYRCYTRRWFDPATGRPFPGWDFGGVAAIRGIQHATSPDFINWSAPEQLEYADGETSVHLYTNAIQPCPGAEHLFVGFPNRFVPERTTDPAHGLGGVNDAVFMASRDGVRWNRWLDAWVPPGIDALNWTERNNYPVWGIAETSVSEWSMYITEHYRQTGLPTRIRRLAIRPWGFVSMHAGYRGGFVTTKLFVCGAERLLLNARTSAAGTIRVEVQDETGSPLPGFGLDAMQPWYGDSLDAEMAWGSVRRISGIVGKPIRLRFFLSDADLFAFRFSL